MSNYDAPRATADGSVSTRTEQRTLGVTYRPGRFARIRLAYPKDRRPSWMVRIRQHSSYPGQTTRLTYDPELAIELVDRTSEIPSAKYDLVVLLLEYRYALYDLATQAIASRRHAA